MAYTQANISAKNATRVLEFIRDAIGAKISREMRDPETRRLIWAETLWGGKNKYNTISLTESPDGITRGSIALHFQMEEVAGKKMFEIWETFKSHGARVLIELGSTEFDPNMKWGSLIDHFGISWNFTQIPGE